MPPARRANCSSRPLMPSRKSISWARLLFTSSFRRSATSSTRKARNFVLWPTSPRPKPITSAPSDALSKSIASPSPMPRLAKPSARRSSPALCMDKSLARKNFRSTRAKSSFREVQFLTVRPFTPGRSFLLWTRTSWFPFLVTASPPHLPLPYLSHSMEFSGNLYRCLMPFSGRMRMSEQRKGSTQTVPPSEESSAHREPSAKEQAWVKNTLQPALEKNPERQTDFTTISGHPIRRLYTKANLANWDPSRDLGFPGEPPYTRGIHSTMHRSRLWTMRQFAGFGTAEDTNQRFRYLLAQGQTGLSTAFDLPTLMGYDSDHPKANGEVGVCGVAIDSLEDVEILYKDLPLDQVSTSMTINGPAAIIFCMFLV